MNLIQFTAPSFSGDCTIDVDFKPHLDFMNDAAVKYSITVVVIDSLRKPTNHLPGEIVPPAKMSNHLIGHAIDCNFKYEGRYYNHVEMMSAYKQDGAIRNFIEELIASGIRWGGLFSTPDSVHFDDGLNLHNPELWHEKYHALNQAA